MSRYRHFGLTREPFDPEPDLAFQAPALGQVDALARLTDFVAQQGDIALVSGGPGLGKTLLRLALARDLAPQPALHVLTLDRPGEWGTDVAFLRAVSGSLDGEATGRTTLDLLTEIEERLALFAEDDHRPLVLIDDAHRLTSSQLELIRTMASLEPDGLSLILFAEPELEERIARRRSLDGRVALRHTLNPLNSNDTKQLLYRRLEVAGAADDALIFDRGASEWLARRSGGNPGEAIALAARSLDIAARRQATVIDRAIVAEAAGERYQPDVVARQIAFDLGEIEMRAES